MHGPASTQCGTVSLNHILYLLVIAVFVWLVVHPASAHAPSDMSISYNELSKELQVTITHQVPNPQAHYVREVSVTINAKVVTIRSTQASRHPIHLPCTYPVLPYREIQLKLLLPAVLRAPSAVRSICPDQLRHPQDQRYTTTYTKRQLWK